MKEPVDIAADNVEEVIDEMQSGKEPTVGNLRRKKMKLYHNIRQEDPSTQFQSTMKVNDLINELDRLIALRQGSN